MQGTNPRRASTGRHVTILRTMRHARKITQTRKPFQFKRHISQICVIACQLYISANFSISLVMRVSMPPPRRQEVLQTVELVFPARQAAVPPQPPDG